MFCTIKLYSGNKIFPSNLFKSVFLPFTTVMEKANTVKERRCFVPDCSWGGW